MTDPRAREKVPFVSLFQLAGTVSDIEHNLKIMRA
jgi:protein involved in ribonucleotide reduction